MAQVCRASSTQSSLAAASRAAAAEAGSLFASDEVRGTPPVSVGIQFAEVVNFVAGSAMMVAGGMKMVAWHVYKLGYSFLVVALFCHGKGYLGSLHVVALMGHAKGYLSYCDRPLGAFSDTFGTETVIMLELTFVKVVA